jgi:hypothetical protein
MSGRFAIGDELAREEMPEIVKPRALEVGPVHNWSPISVSNMSGSMNPWQAPGNTKTESALPTFRGW